MDDPVYLLQITTQNWTFNVKLHPEMQIEVHGDPTWQEITKEFTNLISGMQFETLESFLVNNNLMKSIPNPKEN